MIHPFSWSIESLTRRRRLYPHEVTFSSEFAYIVLDYLKPKNKVILDVGAYVGDTAKLFLKHGARKVVCIEVNKEWAKQINLPNTEVIIEPFCLDHLSIPHDAMKMNIEGYETELLSVPPNKLERSLVTTHCLWITEQFIKAGWHPLRAFDSMGGENIMVNE